MADVLENAALILLFILLGGVFSAAEMALVSLRDSQVKQLAVTRGSRGRSIQKLQSNPNRFLSSVQIGVTVSGFLASAFGGATLANQLAPVFVSWGMSASVASTVALVIITIIISYFSIVLGELVAKRLAMQRAEGFSLVLGPMVNGIATLFRPIIWFLGVSTNFVVKILGGDPGAAREEVTDEEIRSMVVSSATLGDEERTILDEVFAVGEKSLREVMVPRTEVDFLQGSMTAAQVAQMVRDGSHSRYPVIDGSADRVLGFVHVRDLLELDPQSRNSRVSQLVRTVISLPDSVKVLKALTELRRTHAHLAIVLDEYGGTAGIVTLEDLVEEIVGDITDEYDTVEPSDLAHVRQRDIDGLTTIEEFSEKVGLVLPEGPYDTVAGYFMAQTGQVPVKGAQVNVHLFPVGFIADDDEEQEELAPNVELTVTEVDGLRAAWLRVRRLDAPIVTSGASAAPHSDREAASA
ncbi:hemolysin family protein [Cutibacterium sp.]|uniref:hemolysin family protein n=1 Tax=Cutibacterium sp. TaxID=1912221 RepID=UPI0026DB44D9|nr:hemolysin family protein [Cutibacterium sp.]MDO4413217.1 hemolysin family protein [Cutibacterium sp.]